MPDIRGIRGALDSLKKTIHDMEKVGYPIGKLRSVYAELYVANKLAKFSPQIGCEKEVSSADIYLAKIGKRVEVKAGEKGVMADDALFCWSIAPKQLKQKKFDYCVMIGFDRSLRIVKELIFTYEDFEKEPRHRPNFMHESAGICYYSRDYSGKTPLTELERRLKEHPKNYEGRWDRIK